MSARMFFQLSRSENGDLSDLIGSLGFDSRKNFFYNPKDDIYYDDSGHEVSKSYLAKYYMRINIITIVVNDIKIQNYRGPLLISGYIRNGVKYEYPDNPVVFSRETLFGIIKNPSGQGGSGHSALDYAGLLAGGADTYFGVRGEAVHNSMYWVQKNGTVRLASAAKSNVLYKNSYKVVGNLTSASKIASASFAGVGTVISGVQFVSNPTYANAFDAAMGLTSFIPVAGWAISGTYFIANIGCQIITDKTLGQQIFGDTKVY
jgi:hypothetical protein